jgi:outer membrane biogenesis lipoprotein LolB
METPMLSHARRLTALIAVLTLAGCANELGPENERTVVNVTAVFNLDDVNDSERFQWENTGTRARIEIIQGVTSGAALLTIQDPEGTLLYRDDIADENDAVTDVGVPGIWIIEVGYDGTSGAFNFTVAKED